MTPRPKQERNNPEFIARIQSRRWTIFNSTNTLRAIVYGQYPEVEQPVTKPVTEQSTSPLLVETAAPKVDEARVQHVAIGALDGAALQDVQKTQEIQQLTQDIMKLHNEQSKPDTN